MRLAKTSFGAKQKARGQSTEGYISGVNEGGYNITWGLEIARGHSTEGVHQRGK